MAFDVFKAIMERRTVRRYKQESIPEETLKKLVNTARVAPSAANLQPLEYVVIKDPQILPKVFETVKWAGYIAPAGNPKEGERPTAYIVVIVSKNVNSLHSNYDAGAAIENISLAAWEEGIGSCWIRSVERNVLKAIINVPDTHEIDSVVALGYKAENPKEEGFSGSIKYWKDKDDVLHVPKRKMEDIFHWDKF